MKYGRWHTPDIKQREVYLRYGKLLAEKLALQQTYEKLPFTNNRRSLPTSLDKKEYQGIHAFVLALNDGEERLLHADIPDRRRLEE